MDEVVLMTAKRKPKPLKRDEPSTEPPAQDDWQTLAEDTIALLQRGASDYKYTIALRKRRDALKGLPPDAS